MLRDIVARLAGSTDADPQARDEEPLAVTTEESRTEDSPSDISKWVTEYQQNPLIRQPIRNFAADVLEPGVTADVDADGDDPPTTRSDHPNPDLAGKPLDDALETWLSQAAVVGGQFGGDVADLLDRVVKDRRGRRGSAIVEHAYADAEERERLAGLRLFPVETTTAYTRPGKAILVRPDDTPGEIQDSDDSVFGPGSLLRNRTRHIPTTAAGQTAAFVQFDDIFRSDERDEIPFSLEDVTFLANDPDTGDIFGRPDSAPVVDRSKALRDQFGDLDNAISALAHGHWIAQVDTNDQDKAQELVDDLDPEDPTKINGVNYEVELQQFDGQSPDIVDNIQQEIEFILSAMPTPLYRVGFAGDINRDITTEQREDYRDEIRRERDRLESAFSPILRMKARELLGQDIHEGSLDVDVELVIEPEEDENPLHDEEFDAEEFSKVMQGIKAAAPGGATEQVVPVHEIRETFLGLDPETPEAPDTGGAMALPDETDPQVQAAFEDAYLGTRYSEGDVVQSPQGLGVVTEVRTEDFEGKSGEVAASESSPTYVVGLKDARVGVEFYKASQLSAAEMPETGVENPTAALAEPSTNAALAETTFTIPESWRESDTPARVILLDAWASMGGSFEDAKDELGSAELAASMKDRVLQWEGWRKGGG